jgi:hypothetical protein
MMTGKNIERWERENAELEIRRWLIAHNLWAPDAERLAPVEAAPAPAEAAQPPQALLEALLVSWPALRERLEGQLAARKAQDTQLYGYHAERTILEFEQVLRNLTQLMRQLER